MIQKTVIKSPLVSFCCSAIEHFRGEVMLSGYTIEMVLMVSGKCKDVKYPIIDTWKMEWALKEIKVKCMDRLLIPKKIKQINIKKQNGNLTISSDKISITLPEQRVVLLDCENFMMDEVASLFLKETSKKFSDKKIGMKISFGKPVGEVEVWL